MPVLPLVSILPCVTRLVLASKYRLCVCFELNVLVAVPHRKIIIFAPDKVILHCGACNVTLFNIYCLWKAVKVTMLCRFLDFGWRQFTISCLCIEVSNALWNILGWLPGGLFMVLPLDMILCATITLAHSQDFWVLTNENNQTWSLEDYLLWCIQSPWNLVPRNVCSSPWLISTLPCCQDEAWKMKVMKVTLEKI